MLAKILMLFIILPLIERADTILVTKGEHSGSDMQIAPDERNFSGIDLGILSKEFPQHRFSFEHQEEETSPDHQNRDLIYYFNRWNPAKLVVKTTIAVSWEMEENHSAPPPCFGVGCHHEPPTCVDLGTCPPHQCLTGNCGGNPNQVPEPASILLAGMGIAVLLFGFKNKRVI